MGKLPPTPPQWVLDFKVVLINIYEAGGIFMEEKDPLVPKYSFMGISFHNPYKLQVGRVSTLLCKLCSNDVRLRHNTRLKQFNGKGVSSDL